MLQQFTCYNTPENNAIMERVWRTIAEMAIAMLVDSGLPETFWEEARRHAVYIYNRVPPVREPTDNSAWMCPNERYYGTSRTSSLKHLTIPFGAKVVAFIDKKNVKERTTQYTVKSFCSWVLRKNTYMASACTL